MLSTEIGSEIDLVRKLSILFVDDDDEVCESMMRFLGRRVDKVSTAQNGRLGLKSFLELRPDLVISDIQMDEMDGLDMCRAIREADPNLPLIIISAHNESEVLMSSIDLGITKYIVKPVDTRVLMRTILNIAETLDRQRKVANSMQQLDSLLNESDYESERVKDYVSHFLETKHLDAYSNIRHLNIPKLRVSGDFLSVAQHQNDLYVMLADGCGHGLSAVIPALQMPKIFQLQATQGFSLLTIAADINRLLREQNIADHFVATTLLRINSHEHYIEVLNCGNPPVLVFDDAGNLLLSGESKSAALGMLDDEAFNAQFERFMLEQNARIYLFTDGLPDTLQFSDPSFDNGALQAMLRNDVSNDGFDAVASLLGAVPPHCKVDDVTLLEIRFDCEGTLATNVAASAPVGMSVNEVVPIDLHQVTMLYVEDDDMTREYLSHYLSRRMGMLYVAKNGQEGLELFKLHRPQIVLADIKMPQMDGLAMAEEIRKLDKEVPIILTSGSDTAEDAERMFEMGISSFQMKPMEPARLTKAIQTCIQQSDEINRLYLSASAFQASSLAVITSDSKKCIVAVNPAFCRITGYSLAEVIGHSPVLLSSGEHEASHYQSMWHALDESGSWSGELRCQHKNGITVSEWITANAVKGKDGALTGYHFIFSDLAERQINDENMHHLALHDSLTGLPNRAMFADRMSEVLAQSKNNMGSMALINVKIDHFIDINNVLGVRAGDEVILAVANRLVASVDASDLVCRTGGVEFSVLMQEVGGREAIERAVLGLFNVIAEPIEVSDQRIHLRMSAGVSLYPGDGDTYEELVKSASSAIDDAHHAGGGVYRFFDHTISRHKEHLSMLRSGIKSAIQCSEFFMLYQPKFSYRQQKVVGAEALIRWRHPVAGLISPVEFIPLAENSGDVIELSEWIIETVCAQLAEWRRLGLPQVPVSINISPMHFWRGDLIRSLQNAMKKWDITTEQLTIEVTEGVVMDTSDRTLQVLGELKKIGFHLSIDDFGTGYSSLKYLKNLPISELKIDRSFVIEIPEEGEPNDSSKTAVIRAIIQLAAEFKLSLVAEGVETEHQRNFMLENGCDVIQGYLFSKPIPADEFAELLS
ncbi:MAG: EAL domain-containing protein [Gallionellaceae bacterium]